MRPVQYAKNGRCPPPHAVVEKLSGSGRCLLRLAGAQRRMSSGSLCQTGFLMQHHFFASCEVLFQFGVVSAES